MIHVTNIAWMLYILSIIVWSLHDFEPCVNLFYKWKRLFLGKIVFYSTFFTRSDSFLNFYQTLQPKCRIYTGDSISQERVVLLFYWSYFLNQRSPVRLVDWRCPRLKTICPTVCLGQVLLLWQSERCLILGIQTVVGPTAIAGAACAKTNVAILERIQ